MQICSILSQALIQKLLHKIKIKNLLEGFHTIKIILKVFTFYAQHSLYIKQVLSQTFASSLSSESLFLYLVM